MKTDMTIQAEQYISQGKKRRNRGRIVTALSVVVALATTYVLMLPGITMERDAQCGIEAHQHGDSCYTANLICTEAEREASEAELVSLACGFTPHQHTADCYRDGELACGKTDEYFHEHDALCRDGEGNLICTLKENIKHEHTGSCYEEVTELTCETKETTGHEHTDDCYTLITAAQPACGMEENEGHQHTEACTTKTITCGQEEQQGHIHNDSCKQIEKTLTCTQTEAAAHTHGDSCYTTSTQLSCGLGEGEGAHTHGDSCYTAESTLTCGKTEGEGAHSHNDGCYTTEHKQTCGKSEGEGAHDHSDACYSSSKKLACTTAEHTHTDACKDAEGNITCTEAEHAHGEACYTTEKNLTCSISESAGHSHSDACYTSEKKLSCTTAETAGHAHSDACYTTANKLTCTTAENAGHVHSDACYVTTQAMSCSLEETAGHTHGAECYAETESIICGMAEGEGAHTHADTCYTLEQTCALSEGGGAHVHSEACYPTENTLTCGKEEGEGAHTHTEECYTTERRETCDHPELHEHEADCFETDENNKRWCICELVELQEHQHSENCLHTEMISDAGHVHAEGCYEPVLVCEIAEHVHTDECYPDTTSEPTAELTVSPEATAELTLEPAVTAEPTMVPETTEEPVSRPENEEQDTTEPVVTPGVSAEPTKSQIDATTTGTDLEETAAPTATTEVVITAEPTEAPAETAKPTASPENVATESNLSAMEKPAATLEPTSVPESTEQPSASNHVVTTETDLTPVPTAEPAPDADITTSSDLQGTVSVTTATDLNTNTEQFRQPVMMAPAPSTQPDAEQDVIYFEGERLYCGNPDHEHTYDCLFACGKVEHIHGDGMSVFAMFASAGDDHTHTTSCYDENGELVCELEEHVHTEACLLPRAAAMMTSAGSARSAADFKDYVNDASVSGNAQTEYIPELDGYATNIKFSFSMDNTVLKGSDSTTAATKFTYALPQNVSVPDSFLNTTVPLTITGSSTEGAYFKVVKSGDIYVVEIDLEAYAKEITASGTTSGNLNFDCILGASYSDSEGNLNVEFDVNNNVTINKEDIIYPADETNKYQIASQKDKGIYDPANNTLTYTVLVSSTKGTPGVIDFTDTMNLSGVNIQSWSTSVKYYTDVNSKQDVSINPTVNGNSMSMQLPQISGLTEGQTGVYEVTYVIQLQDLGVNNVSVNGTNNVQVHSEDTTTGRVVSSNDSSSAEVKRTVLDKTGSFDSTSEKINWTIVVNESGVDIAGQTVSDDMFALASGDIVISPADGVNRVTNEAGKVTGFTFAPVENGKNNKSYTITYSTETSGDYSGNTSAKNKATFGEGKATDEVEVWYDRKLNEKVTKSNTGSSKNEDNKTMNVDWKTTIKIDGDGLSNDVTVSDNMQQNNEHYMTYAQVQALYNTLVKNGWMGSNPFKVKYITNDEYYNTQVSNWVDFSTLSENADKPYKFTAYEFVLESDVLSDSQYWNKDLELTYSSTADYSYKTNDATYNNSITVGDTTVSDSFEFKYKEQFPVIKYCSQCWSTTECSHTSNTVVWNVEVFQNDNYNSITIKDKLPEGVVLKQIMNDGNGHNKIVYSGDGTETEYVDLKVESTSGHLGFENNNIKVDKATYNPATGDIELILTPAGTGNGNENQFAKDKTIKVRFVAEYVGGNSTTGESSGEVRLTNNAKVYTDNSTDIYGEDSQTTKLTPTVTEALSKLDLRQPGDTDGYTEYSDYQKEQFGWQVRVEQDKEYDEIVITDTLPEGVSLVYIQTGPNNQEVKLELPENAQSGIVSLIPSNNYNTITNYKLDISAKYDIDDRQITLTVKKADNWESASDIFGAGKTLIANIYCAIDSSKLPNEENQTVQLTFTNEVEAELKKAGEETVKHDDEQTQKYNLSYTPRVVKTDAQNNANDTTVNNADGTLSWKVKIHQEEDYEYLVIEDQLPAGVVVLQNTGSSPLGCISLNNGFWLRLPDDANLQGSEDITLELNNQYNSNKDQLDLGSEATFNPATGKIRIKLFHAAGRTYQYLKAGQNLELQFYCKVADNYMPNNADGEYVKELGKLTNSVTVQAGEIPYGSDTHTQDVTITQQRGDVDTVKKGHTWKGITDSYQMSYSVDINADALELDPTKNTLTVVDQVSYYRNEYSDQRDLSLVQESVVLYYADYDENDQPIKDENGRLVRGKLVDYADWTMTYQENKVQNGNCTCTMTLTVPDNEAMILEYKYKVSMKSEKDFTAALGITNTVKIEGFENDQFQDRTSDDEKWSYTDAGGQVGTGHVYKLIKHDKANQANVLAGVQFTVYRYTESNEWTEHQTLLTDAKGTISIQRADNNYQTDVAYRIVETATINGYEMPADAPEYYFYWSANGTVPAGIPEGANAVNLDESNTTTLYPVKIPNTKKSTSLGVEKVWLTANGEQLPGRDLPSSVSVQLRRYAIPDDPSDVNNEGRTVWQQMKHETNDKIDGAITDGGEVTNVSITVMSQNGTNASNNVQFTINNAAIGSKLQFDLRVKKEYGVGEGKWGYYPELNGEKFVSYYSDDQYTYYHYSYNVTKDMKLSGYFTNGSIWNRDNLSNGDNNAPFITLENVKVQSGLPADNAQFKAMLEPYIDRSYEPTAMKLTAAGNWSGSWENLDVEGTVDGKRVHYKYFVTESPVNGFATSVSGYSSDDGGVFVVENRQDNSYTETTSLRVVKEWYDKDGIKTDVPLDGLDKVEIRLYQKDNVTGNEIVYRAGVVINDATNWGFNFTNLPKKTVSAMGVTLYDYSYRIEEVTKGNFTTELVTMDGPITVTNANGTTTVFDKQITVKNSAQKTVSVEVEKVWADKTNAKDNVQVQLYREILKPEGAVPDDSFTHADATKLLDESNDWTFKWENLAAGSDTGDSYRYVVKEIQVDGQDVADAGYIVTYSGNGDGTVANNTTMTITNTPKTSISVKKVWAGNEQLDEVYVTLYKQNQDQQASEVETVEINADALWQHSWAELPAGEVVNGHYVQLFYYVVENAVEGYTTTYTVNGQTQSGNSLPVGSGTITITNSKEQDTGISINVTKQWQNADGSTLGSNLPASISFKVYRKTADGTAEAVKDASNNDVIYMLPAGNAWSMTIDGLDAADAQGNAYTYYVVEDAVEGFTTSYSNQVTLDGNGNVAGTVTGNAVTIINQKNQETTLTISKAWVGDQSGYTVYLRLLKKADDSDTYSYVDPTDYVPEGTTLQLHNGENLLPYAADGNITLTDLPAGTYKVEEVAYKLSNGSVVSITTGMVLPWQVAVSSENVTIPTENAQLTVTNTRETMALTVKKEWLLSDDASTDNLNAKVYIKRYILDDNGQKVIDPAYSVEQTIAYGNTAGVTVNNLPTRGNVKVGDTTYTNKQYYYYVEEDDTQAAAYVVNYSNGNGNSYTTADEAALSAAGTLTVTNTEATDLTVTKKWVAADGTTTIDPAYNEVTVKLLRDVKSTTENPGGGGTVEPDPDPPVTTDVVTISFEFYKPINNWSEYGLEKEFGTYQFKKNEIVTWTIVLDGWFKFTDNQSLIKYGGYQTYERKELNTNGLCSHTFTFTASEDGTFAIGIWTEADLSNKWGDSTFSPAGTLVTSTASYSLRASNASAIPATATVVPGYESITLTKGENWTKAFQNLPVVGKDENGNIVEYSYYVQEIDLPAGFAVSYGNSGEFVNGEETITNTLTEEPQSTALTITKQWFDANNQPKQPLNVDAVYMKLLQNGTDYTNNLTQEANGVELVGDSEKYIKISPDSNDNWAATISNLPLNDTSGNPYTYALEEYYLNGTTYTKVNDALFNPATANANGAVTVTNSVESLTVTKVWRDAQNQNDVTAPTDAQVTLELWRRPEGISGGSQDALVERFTLPINNAWTKSYDNLPSGYTYYAKETAATNAEAFQVYYGNNGETMAIQDSDGNIVVTNVQQDMTTISARKVWQSADGTTMENPPAGVTMQLYRRSLTEEQWNEFVGSGEEPGGNEPGSNKVRLTVEVRNSHVGGTLVTSGYVNCSVGDVFTVTVTDNSGSTPNFYNCEIRPAEARPNMPQSKHGAPYVCDNITVTQDTVLYVCCGLNEINREDVIIEITESGASTAAIKAATTDWMTGGTAVEGTQVQVGTNGYTWPPQPSRDGNNYYYYYVQEVDGSEGYAASYAYTYDAENGTYEYTVTNTRDEQQPTNTNLVIRKVWVGAGEDKPETISFTVTRKDSVATENNITEFILNVTEKDGLLTATKPAELGGGEISIQKDDSTTADDWTMTISNLPQIQMAEGVITHNYIYTVEEVEIEGYDTTTTVTDDGTTYTFTNTKANELKVEKVWANQADKLESVRFELWRYKIPKDGNIETTPGDKTLNVEIKVDNYTLTSASKTGLKANDYVVWTAEYAHNNYTDFYPSDSSKNTITYNGMSIPFAGTSSTAKPYIFVHTIGPIGENGGNATWITDNWYHGTPGDGANVGQWVHKFEVLSSNYQEEPVGTETYVLNESNNWQMSFDSSVLIPSDDQYNYTYFVKEVVPANYDVTYSNNDGILSGTITMTNTKQAPLPTIGSLTVNKTWGEGTTPTESISFTLYRQAGENGTKEKVREEAYTLPTAENVWSMTIDELPLVDGSGTPYIYSVEETPMEGYYASYSGSVTLNAQPNQTGSITITNLVPGKTYTSLSTSKVWHDEIEAPGKGSPTTFDLYQVKTPKATTNAPAEYVDIKFRIVYREGTLSETTVRFPKGVQVQWIPTWSFNGDFHPGGTEGSTTYSMGSFSWTSGREANVNVTRKHSEFENQKTEYTISIGEVTQNDTLVWTVENDFRPLGENESSWTTERIRIWAHDFRVVGTNTSTEKIREDCPTGTTIDNLPLEDADFTYSYFIEENGFDDYVKSYTGSLNSDGSQHITIHNTWIPTQLVVSKKWLDANMQVMTAPSGYSITYELYRLDGDAPVLVDTMTLPKSGGSWSHTYTKLADHVEYRVVETVVKRGDGVVITNQYNDMYKLIENGKTGEWTSTNGVEVELNGWHLDSQMEIGNQLITGYVLPETGGEGTHMYTGAGAMLVGIALTLLYKGNKRKRRAEEK